MGIPITADGCFLAYKGVRADYKDVHSGIFDNSPGQSHEMDRAAVSDDPNYHCHFGFHVGSESYAKGFGPKVVICKVDPEYVVCVPNDYECQKMRVCKYSVIGNYGCQLPSTVFEDEPEVTEAISFDVSASELLSKSIEELRQMAQKLVVGARHIQGGKLTLVSLIMSHGVK